MNLLREICISFVCWIAAYVFLTSTGMIHITVMNVAQHTPAQTPTTTPHQTNNQDNQHDTMSDDFNSCATTSLGDCYPAILLPEPTPCIRGYRFNHATGKQVWFQTETEKCKKLFKKIPFKD